MIHAHKYVHMNLLKTEFLKPGEVQQEDELAMQHEAG